MQDGRPKMEDANVCLNSWMLNYIIITQIKVIPSVAEYISALRESMHELIF